VIDSTRLLTDTKALVRALVDDLRLSADNDGEVAEVVDREYGRASAAGRTALGKGEWAEGLYAQVAVAWVLGAAFVRFCEDNRLVDEPLLAGPGPRRAIALDHRSAHLQANPAHDDRHWLRDVFTRYRAIPATVAVFGDHNPVWLLAPSADGARQVVQAVQAVDPDTGELRHDFTDPAWDTRFLGDLYQDLSEHAKKTYALLQTPIFVEEFILDRTLEPALATFGLREVTAIDPTCGSGHFLLGIFARLFERWCGAEPGTNRRELARRALDVIGGVDLNPFAASIARFRLLVAALRAGGDKQLADAPAYPIHIAVGDSLLHGDPPGRLAGTSFDEEVAGVAAHGYATEDVEQARALLSRSWHVVVGNPPYVTVKDSALNALYRVRFETCRGKYSLGVPFTERFFQLARQDNDLARSGYVGMITANTFMKREMGKNLVERWVPLHDLTLVVDTSGAFIPGHGVPTVILCGRNRKPVSPTVQTLMGIRSEPRKPAKPEKGLVWSSIIDVVSASGLCTTRYVSSRQIKRARLAKHPWSIGGGGAAELKDSLDKGRTSLASAVQSIGVLAVLGEEAPLKRSDLPTWNRAGVEKSSLLPLCEGEQLRDWSLLGQEWVVFPYTDSGDPRDTADAEIALWPWRSTLAAYVFFGKRKRERGLRWLDYGALMRERWRVAPSIAFAAVATHNHFVFDRGGRVFKQSAPVIKLPNGTSDTRYFELLGPLNSSTGAFWMQQVFHNKGRPGAELAAADERYEFRYDHDSTKLESFPLPSQRNSSIPIVLDKLARLAMANTPGAVVLKELPEANRITAARKRWAAFRGEMIAAQERLDWEVYRLYGLVDEDLTTGAEPEPPLQLGERAFEIVLARKMAGGEEESSWFTRHGSTPITDLPAYWSESYKRLVERRIELIETDLNIGLIEQPEYKRRWAAKPWHEQVKVALRGWLLDRLEAPRYWPEPPAITTTARLAAEVRTDAEFMQVARLYAERDDLDLAALVGELVKAEAVPYLAALRFTDSGLRKHAQWLETWELQRREDAGEDVGPIPVPPKYTKADFAGLVWDHRGKLDVPKERFISYPGAERETDASLPVGWAGWDHLARARALATWYLQARRDGRDVPHLMPLLAGLAELFPWLKQWHDEPNPDPALDRPGTQIAALVDAELRVLQLTPDALSAWGPQPARRGRRRRS
jgi:hypothetical protein